MGLSMEEEVGSGADKPCSAGTQPGHLWGGAAMPVGKAPTLGQGAWPGGQPASTLEWGLWLTQVQML